MGEILKIPILGLFESIRENPFLTGIYERRHRHFSPLQKRFALTAYFTFDGTVLT